MEGFKIDHKTLPNLVIVVEENSVNVSIGGDVGQNRGLSQKMFSVNPLVFIWVLQSAHVLYCTCNGSHNESILTSEVDDKICELVGEIIECRHFGVF